MSMWRWVGAMGKQGLGASGRGSGGLGLALQGCRAVRTASLGLSALTSFAHLAHSMDWAGSAHLGNLCLSGSLRPARTWRVPGSQGFGDVAACRVTCRDPGLVALGPRKETEGNLATVTHAQGTWAVSTRRSQGLGLWHHLREVRGIVAMAGAQDQVLDSWALSLSPSASVSSVRQARCAAPWERDQEQARTNMATGDGSQGGS